MSCSPDTGGATQPFPAAAALGSGVVPPLRLSHQRTTATERNKAVPVTSLGAGRGRAPASVPGLREKVVAIEVHDLVPGSHEVTRELLLRVVTGVDL